MTYSIIGSGNVGKALARHFARSGIDVVLANTRGPDTLAALAQELGRHVVPGTVQDALAADVIVLAMPFRAHADVARQLADWSGKIVVDAMNPYGVPPQQLAGRASSEIVAAALPGVKLVKTFNQLPAALLASDPAHGGGRRVMFVASDDADAANDLAQLVERLGFAAIGLGPLAAGGQLIGLGGPLILNNLIKFG